jgi:hypothetical protein
METQANILLRNDRGVFVDVAVASGLTDVQPTDNALWLDYDRDGYLDLYTGSLGDPLSRNLLYRNLGDGTFAEVTAEAGLPFQFHPELGGSNGGMVAADVNDDGWPDLYVAVFGAPNRLFLNNRGTFVDATSAEIADHGEAFGVTAGDTNSDGHLDLMFAAGGSLSASYRSGVLMNLGSGTFADAMLSSGLGALAASSRVLGLGLGDIDNDGDLDLVAGWSPSRLFLNDGQGVFTDRSTHSGLVDNSLFTMAFGDIDLDGSLDLLGGGGGNIYTPVLHRNLGGNNHWLRVELVGMASNRSAIGARLVAISGDRRQTREIFGGLGYYQDEMVAHFGLGEHAQVERLEIRWPSGQVDHLEDVAADQVIRVIEGRPGYHAVEPARWATRLPDSLVSGSTVRLSVGTVPALFDSEARVTGVSVDLSPLGGEAAVAMSPAVDDTYQLRGYPLRIGVPNGVYAVPVTIDQQTAAGPRWTRLSTQVTVVPSAACQVYADALLPDWAVVAQRGLTIEPGSAAQAYAGTSSMALHAGARWSLTLQPTTPVNSTGYHALRFALHPGDVSGKELSVSVGGQRADLSPGVPGGVGVNLADRNWRIFEIPLGPPSADRKLGAISFSGTLQGTLYLDDINLLAVRPSTMPGTAVTEAQAAVPPQAFTLPPNYPNPFNSSTVVRFAVPVPAEVDLVVYNLAGQRVAQLASGQRAAGTHTITWTGADAHGRQLASGVYLLRLESAVGAQVRRVTLLR